MNPALPGPRALRRVLAVALAIGLPWLWFAVRDVGGRVDAVAVGLPLVGLAAIVSTAILAVVTRRALPLITGASVFAVCATAVIGPRLPRSIPPPDPAVRVVMANVWDANATPIEAPSSLLGHDADVVAAVELPDGGFLQTMTAEAASAGLDSSVRGGGLAVWSRFPMLELDDPGFRFARVMRLNVDAPESPFVLYLVHALNPLRETSFAQQRRFTEDLLAAVRAEERPAVVAGDFNMSDRAVSYRTMDDALVDAMRAGVAGRTTYVGGWWSTLLLRIDHVFVDPTWCAADPGTFAVNGSDHRGVTVDVGPCA
ncbi:MAG: endonuclease/exonuclease/phosphatase family protein [Actinomycetota bacterium]